MLLRNWQSNWSAIIKSIYRSDLKDRINIIGFDYFEDTEDSGLMKSIF